MPAAGIFIKSNTKTLVANFQTQQDAHIKDDAISAI